MEPNRDAWQLDAICALLGDDYRRQALRCLGDGRETTRTELARAVVERRSETDSVEEAAAALHHVHLPKLAAEDAVAYDPGDGTVRITDEGERLREILAGIERLAAGAFDAPAPGEPDPEDDGGAARALLRARRDG
jgi:hypothetical protein